MSTNLINPLDLSGKVIVVTGASSGIGRETAILLSRLNARVVLVARDESRIRETSIQMEANQHSVEVFDLLNSDGIPPLIRKIASREGPLHGIVHCAGLHELTPLPIITTSQIHDMMEVNVNCAILLARGFRQRNCHAPGASMVLISSIAGFVGHAGLTVYTATKAAVLGITKSLSVELRRDSIRVNCLAPGRIATPMTDRFDQSNPIADQDEANDLKSITGDPIDVAYPIAFLLSDASRWINGAAITVDGGLTAGE